MAYKSNDGYAESSGDHPVDGIDLSERGVSCHRVGAQVIQRSLYDDIRDIIHNRLYSRGRPIVMIETSKNL